MPVASFMPLTGQDLFQCVTLVCLYVLSVLGKKKKKDVLGVVRNLLMDIRIAFHVLCFRFESM